MARPKTKQADAAALPNAAAILREILGPDNVRATDGPEIDLRNFKRGDTDFGSFKFNQDTGAWADFAVEHFKGNGLSQLIAMTLGITLASAVKKLEGLNEAGFEAPEPKKPKKTLPALRIVSAEEEEGLGDGSGRPDVHFDLGFPDEVYAYTQKAGTAFWVYRFDLPEGKETRPLCFDEDKNDWVWRLPKGPWTPYRQGDWASRKVVVAEGEKAANAAATLYPDRLVLTNVSGSGNVFKTDWSVLRGTDEALVLPDHDQPGAEYALRVADRVLEGVNRGLAQVSAEMLDLKISKALQTSDWSRDPLLPQQVHYAVADAVIAGVIWPQLKQWMAETESVEAYGYFKRLVYPGIRVAPLRLDVEVHAAWVGGLQDTITREAEALAKVGIANPRSVKQKQEYLEEHLTLDQLIDWPLTESGALSTGREDLLAASWMPEMKSLANYVEAAHLDSNFGSKLQAISADGLLYPDFRIGGARSGRFTSSNPNAQNFPRDFKHMITAGDGQAFVCADYGQIELRVLAEFSQEPVMLEAYQTGKDLHALIGAEGAKVITTDRIRALGKVLNFGLAYGGGPAMLVRFAWSAHHVRLTLEQAVDLKEVWRQFYPDLAVWQRETIEEVRAWQQTQTKHFKITAAQEPDCWSNALNYPVQGTASEILGLALIGVDQHRPEGWSITAHVHDEILMIGPEKTADQAKAVLEEQMTMAFSSVLPEAPTLKLIEAGIGSTWEGAKV